MSFETDLLLSDEFVEFSKHIAEVHASKKKLKDEATVYMHELQQNMKKLDAEADVARQKWEEWAVHKKTTTQPAKVKN